MGVYRILHVEGHPSTSIAQGGVEWSQALAGTVVRRITAIPTTNLCGLLITPYLAPTVPTALCAIEFHESLHHRVCAPPLALVCGAASRRILSREPVSAYESSHVPVDIQPRHVLF